MATEEQTLYFSVQQQEHTCEGLSLGLDSGGRWLHSASVRLLPTSPSRLGRTGG